MKKSTNLLLMLTCVSALALTSCKKEGCTDSNATNYSSKAKKDDGSCTYLTPAPPVSLNTFTMKIDGVEFIETSVTAELETTYNLITIEAKKGVKLFGITMPSTISPGFYTFENFASDAVSSYYFDGTSTFQAEPGSGGSLKIVSKTSPTSSTPGKISGTFSFTAAQMPAAGSPSYSITAGEFNLEYQ